jgi:hypothetical protein
MPDAIIVVNELGKVSSRPMVEGAGEGKAAALTTMARNNPPCKRIHCASRPYICPTTDSVHHRNQTAHAIAALA